MSKALETAIAMCPDCPGYCTTSANSQYLCHKHYQWLLIEIEEAKPTEPPTALTG